MANRITTYELLDGCEVIDETEMAIKVAWSDEDGDIQHQWIPRSVCDSGHSLQEGDTDIAVASWFVNKESLPV